MSCVLGLDPGREKFGWAFGDFQGHLVCGGIEKASFFGKWVKEVLVEGNLSVLEASRTEGAVSREFLKATSRIFLGKGTGSGFFSQILTEADIPFIWSEEAYSTLMARDIYWKLHPPRGWRKILPRGVLVPPRALDDLAAWIVFRQALHSCGHGEALGFPLVKGNENQSEGCVRDVACPGRNKEK